MPRRPSFPFALSAILVTSAMLCSLLASAQSPAREKPKLKDFGQSLKRLKWDPQANAAVEKRDDKKQPGENTELDVVKVETALVVGDFLVEDRKGRSITGLTQSDFIVTEEGQLQEVAVFSMGSNLAVPRSIVLIIDYSSSQFPYLETSIAAANLLIDKLGPLDLMAIVTDDVELIADFTSDKKRLKEKLSDLQRKAGGDSGFLSRRDREFGRSQQYSALMATLKEAFDDEDVRPIVIFQTDGDEVGSLRNSNWNEYFSPIPLPNNLSKEQQERLAKLRQQQPNNVREFSLDDVYRTAEDARATIYTVIPGFRFVGLPPDEQVKQFKASYDHGVSLLAKGRTNPGQTRTIANKVWEDLPAPTLLERVTKMARVQQALAHVSTVTGGLTAFLERPEEADAIYSRILADINGRYMIGYYPKNKEHDGKKRKIKIEVRGHPEYFIAGRKSYYAPKPD